MLKRILFAGPWWHEDLMQGIARHGAGRGWHLNLDPALTGRLPEDWRGDGVLTMLGGDRDELAHFLEEADCPVVSLSLNRPHLPVPRIGLDNKQAGRLAAEHFIERGFTSFAFYARDDQHVAKHRCASFEARLAEAGYPAHRLLIRDGDTPAAGLWVSRQQQIAHMLQSVAKPVGVFGVDDASAVEVIEACLTLGLDVPHQVGVLGMLDMPLFRQSTTVALSSITVDFDRYTAAACELLASLMEGGESPPKPILFPVTGIAARASTDVIAARVPGVVRAIRFMMEHHAQPIGIREIVRASGMSQTRLYAAFEEDVRQTPGAVLTRIRVDKARHMLRETDHKLETISQSCGFGDRINLYRQFKQHLGISPGAYRRGATPPA